MRANPVCWFEIYVDDIARAKAFYETVLHVELQPLPVDGIAMYAFDMSEQQVGAGGALIHVPEVKAGNNSTVVYFACEDCAVEESRVVAAGGQVHRPKMSIGPYGFVTLVIDTEGNLIGLHSMQ
ncbi:MAG TPA: lactoylglutathione lyase [Rheinheimera sp.]|nr:lactoylglutathione lyase [Rheinheimera sp.]